MNDGFRTGSEVDLDVGSFAFDLVLVCLGFLFWSSMSWILLEYDGLPMLTAKFKF
jgi:hypothetical protein